ncbi:MAG: cyclic nucleotide-binding domain-containing protein [Nitrospina sp.]|jgi:CRP-like cAMP-binding protein|nr:cyclic nucleotide-binding domain-containing protein [Nitrospina sp.]
MDIEKAIPKFPIFADFTEEEVNMIFCKDEALQNYHDGEFILRQGEMGSALFILVEGQVRITKSQAPTIELNKLEPGTIFGESPLITSSTRLTNVIAKGEVAVLKLDASRFKALNPAIVSKFHIQLNKLLVSRLNTMNDHLAEAQTGINNFIKIYNSHRKKMEEDPLISDEFKMVQKLWSAYFENLRTK